MRLSRMLPAIAVLAVLAGCAETTTIKTTPAVSLDKIA